MKIYTKFGKISKRGLMRKFIKQPYKFTIPVNLHQSLTEKKHTLFSLCFCMICKIYKLDRFITNK